MARTRVALASPEALVAKRQVMHAESLRLSTSRGEAGARQQEHAEHRLTELVARELARELPRSAQSPGQDSRKDSPPPALDPTRVETGMEPGAGTPRGSNAATTSGAAATEAPTTQVDAALELIERIEVFVKSQRPALSLSLRGSLAATVEVERTGPREVSLRIQGRGAPVPGAALERLREALEARGLRLSTLRSE
ncbi:hypothetical protein LZ198_20380 [Myxococcus sp. K15C18031901]|uniref:hypothetical protein n=1 Tax=Myxococcus dinghuensis TaxID=2906761 RepID=UPI0020A78690|nr:hypothetical protein [Myxococcus dinghuensis]MCP3101235.1 hypothetical protein [Myxococcus dinghuensis]